MLHCSVAPPIRAFLQLSPERLGCGREGLEYWRNSWVTMAGYLERLTQQDLSVRKCKSYAKESAVLLDHEKHWFSFQKFRMITQMNGAQ